MKTPICDSCAWSEELCPQCRHNLASGRISRLDVEVSQILHKINEKHNISAASFCKAVPMGEAVFVFTEGEVGLLIGREGKVVSALSLALGRRVRIVQKSPDVKKAITDLIAPARLLGINTTWTAGTETVRLRLAKEERGRIALKDETLAEVAGSFIGKPVQIIYE
ncbi:MAG: hypothetical protein V1728_06500 [Candidatus Micrarchaeota archaeon]